MVSHLCKFLTFPNIHWGSSINKFLFHESSDTFLYDFGFLWKEILWSFWYRWILYFVQTIFRLKLRSIIRRLNQNSNVNLVPLLTKIPSHLGPLRNPLFTIEHQKPNENQSQEPILWNHSTCKNPSVNKSFRASLGGWITWKATLECPPLTMLDRS